MRVPSNLSLNSPASHSLHFFLHGRLRFQGFHYLAICTVAKQLEHLPCQQGQLAFLGTLAPVFCDFFEETLETFRAT